MGGLALPVIITRLNDLRQSLYPGERLPCGRGGCSLSPDAAADDVRRNTLSFDDSCSAAVSYTAPPERLENGRADRHEQPVCLLRSRFYILCLKELRSAQRSMERVQLSIVFTGG